MKWLFYPSIFLLNRLRYAWKFAFISIFVLIPISLTSYNLVTYFNQGVTTATLGLEGNAYNIPLQSLIVDLQQHRGLVSIYLNGNTAIKSEIQQKEMKIEQDIAVVNQVNQRYGTLLQTTGEWTEIKNQWGNLRGTVWTMNPADSFKRHTAIISQALALLNHVEDTSGLRMYPTLPGNYLVDSVFQTLPGISEELGQTRGLGSGAATTGIITRSNLRCYYGHRVTDESSGA